MARRKAWKFNAKPFTRDLQAHESRQLDIAATFLVAKVKESFGDSGIANATRGQREANRSKPGQPPHVQTANLKKSIAWDTPRRNIRRVGSTMNISKGGYSLFLELGTTKMAARPYLRPAVRKYRNQLRGIVTRPMR